LHRRAHQRCTQARWSGEWTIAA